MKKIFSILLSTIILITTFASFGIESFAATVKAPTNFTATINSTSSVTLKWSKPKNAGKYVIYRKINKSKYKKLKTVSSTSTTITKLSSKNTYSFKVKALTKSGKSGGQTSALTLKTNFGKVSKLTSTGFSAYKYGPGSGWIDGCAFKISSVSGAKGYNFYGKSVYREQTFTLSKTKTGTGTKFYLYGPTYPIDLTIRAVKYDSNKHKIYGPKKTFNLYKCMTTQIDETFYDGDDAELYFSSRGYKSIY